MAVALDAGRLDSDETFIAGAEQSVAAGGDYMVRYLVRSRYLGSLYVRARTHYTLPATFHTQMVETNGTSLYVRVGGQGPAVVLLHGFGDTGDMWAPLAADLAKDHTVIVPDLRGMGLSAHPDRGYTKKNQACRYRRGHECSQCAESRTGHS